MPLPATPARATRKCIASLFACGLLVLTACGEKEPPSVAKLKGLHAVKGKVTSDVGSVTGLTIVFHPNSPEAGMSSGVVKSDGSFVLQTLLPNDGASDGEYKVYFTKEMGVKKANLSIPKKYASPEETDLTATIKPETSDVGTITLKK